MNVYTCILGIIVTTLICLTIIEVNENKEVPHKNYEYHIIVEMEGSFLYDDKHNKIGFIEFDNDCQTINDLIILDNL